MRLKHILFAALVVATAPHMASARDFDGETISIVTNVSAGGATDVQVRLFSEFWKTHVPGGPDVVIDPRPGGGMLLGINHVLENASPDGLNLGWIAPSITTRPLGPENQQVDYERFEIIGSVNIPVITYARVDVGEGLNSPSDLAKIDEITIAGFFPRASFDLNSQIGMELLGINYNYVAGFRGGSAIMAAILRNEAQMTSTGLNSYRAGITDNVIAPGLAIPLWHVPTIDASGNIVEGIDVTEAPSFTDLYQTMKGEVPTGAAYDAMLYVSNGPTLMFVAPPGTDSGTLDVLRASFDQTTTDANYLAAVQEQVRLKPVFFDAEETLSFVRRASVLAETEPEIASYLIDLIARNSE